METDNAPSGQPGLADTVAMLRRATSLLKELRDRMDRREAAAAQEGGIENDE